MVKAIKIDVKEKKIKEVEISNYKDISKEIGCEIFTYVPRNMQYGVYIDDNGLLKDLKSGFVINFYGAPLMGNGIFMKSNEAGEDIDLDLEIGDIESMVKFIDFDESPEAPPIKILPF